MKKRFEYKSVEVKPKSIWTSNVKPEEIDLIINKLGSEGWELVTLVPYSSTGTTVGFLYTFKREI